MKNIFFLTLFLLFAGTSFSQVPDCINYQTIVRDNTGALIKNSTISLKFSILKNSATGQEQYSETHAVTTNEFGIVNLKIGRGSTLSGSFESINWGTSSYFLKTYLDANGGNNFTEMGISEMVSVPYAFFSGSIYVHYSNDTLYIGDQWVYIPSGGNGSTGNNVVDYDGNTYGTIVIGTQTWLSENLKSTNYSDGTVIDGCYDYNNNSSYGEDYGKLYTWDAAMRNASPSTSTPSGVQGACPSGYHLPSINEFQTLKDYVSSVYGGGSIIGKALKEPGTNYWETGNGTNETNFGARGAGQMYIQSNAPQYQYIKENAYFWSTTQLSTNANQAMWFKFYDSGTVTTNAGTNKTNGISVRCIKD